MSATERIASAEEAALKVTAPLKAFLALLTAVAVLAVAHWWPARGVRGLEPTVIADAWRVRWPKRPVAVAPGLTIGGGALAAGDTRGAVAGNSPVATSAKDAERGIRGGAGALSGAGTLGTAGAGSTVGAGAAAVAGTAGTDASASAGAGSGAVAGGFSPVMADAAHALDPFYAQLWKLQGNQGGIVTVLHYGDSPTTADLITGDIREILQDRFGDAGHGFNLGAKPWAWYGHRDVEIKDSGWASSQKDATGVGKMKQALYGLGGAIFSGNVGAQTTFTLKDADRAPATAAVIDYLQQPGGGSLAVSADGNSIARIDTNGPAALPAAQTVHLPPGTKALTVSVASGSVKWFGADFRRGDHGVIYDSMGLNGATTTVLSRTFDPAAWQVELQEAKPSLIVINYGTNESQFGGLVTTLESELKAAIAKARAAAPGVPILVMSPMDRGERSGAAIATNAQIPKIVEIQQRVAAQTGCAYFNTYAAMGGDGTIARWYAANPRLVTADLIHPTPQGAVIVARLFVDNLYAGFDDWKRRNGIGVVRVMNATEAAAKKKEEADRKKAEALAAKKAAAKASADKKAAGRKARLQSKKFHDAGPGTDASKSDRAR